MGELQARLANAEKQLVDLHDRRAADIAAAEARLREENIRLRVRTVRTVHCSARPVVYRRSIYCCVAVIACNFELSGARQLA